MVLIFMNAGVIFVAAGTYIKNHKVHLPRGAYPDMYGIYVILIRAEFSSLP